MDRAIIAKSGDTKIDFFVFLFAAWSIGRNQQTLTILMHQARNVCL